MMFKWMFNCHEVNRMISAGMDTNLPLLQRVLIRFHLMMCRHCAQVSRQLFSLRAYCRYLDSDDGSVEHLPRLAPDTRQRIKAHLKLAQTQIIPDPEPGP